MKTFSILSLAIFSLSTASTIPAARAEQPLIPRAAVYQKVSHYSPSVSPDGQYIAWIAPSGGADNLFVAPANNPSAGKRVTNAKGRGIGTYFWSFKPGVIIVQQDVGGDENPHIYALDISTQKIRDLTPYPKTRANVERLSLDETGTLLVSMNDRDPKWHDLYRVDIASGKRTLVLKNVGKFSGFRVDGKLRPVFAFRELEDGGTEVLKATTSGEWLPFDRITSGDSANSEILEVTSDGKTLYVQDSRGRNTAALYAVDVATGKRTLVFEDPRADVQSIVFDPVTLKPMLASTDYLHQEWRAVDPTFAEDLAEFKKLGQGNFKFFGMSNDHRKWFLGFVPDNRPPSTYIYTKGAKQPLVKFKDAFPELNKWTFEPTRSVELHARDGLPMVAYYTLPEGSDRDGDGKPDKPLPMVLSVHGGPWYRDRSGFNLYDQWLANRGYAVMNVNFRGSTGFGKDSIVKSYREWGGKMHDDLIDAVDWAIAQGITTRDKVAIEGGSYGGYAALVGMTFTPDRFRCGIDAFGPSNLVTFLKTIPPYWESSRAMFRVRVGDDSTPDGIAFLNSRSPINKVGAIQGPLLIVQGSNDARVVKAESDQMVAAMQAKGLPVTYMVFPDEGHGFGRHENTLAYTAATENFLAKCLGGRTDAFGDALKGSSAEVPVGASHIDGLEAALKNHTPDIRK